MITILGLRFGRITAKQMALDQFEQASVEYLEAEANAEHSRYLASAFELRAEMLDRRAVRLQRYSNNVVGDNTAATPNEAVHVHYVDRDDEAPF